MTSRKKVRNDIQKDLMQGSGAAGGALNNSVGSNASATNQMQQGLAGSGRSFGLNSGTNPQQVRNDIQQDLAGTTGRNLGVTSGTNPQKVRNDIQQDLTSGSAAGSSFRAGGAQATANTFGAGGALGARNSFGAGGAQTTASTFGGNALSAGNAVRAGGAQATGSAFGAGRAGMTAATNAQQVRNDIAQDVAGTTGRNMNFTSGTDPQKVQNDIAQDLNQSE